MKTSRKATYGPGWTGNRGSRDGIPQGYKHQHYKQQCRCLETNPCTCGLREGDPGPLEQESVFSEGSATPAS